MNKILNYIGIARRAGFLISGTDAVIESLKNKARLVFIASDASNGTTEKLEKKCFFYHVDINKDYSTDELAIASGYNNPKVLAITDKGICESIKKLIEERGINHESY